MRLWKIPYSIPGQLLTALLASILILGPAGCTTFTGNPAGDPNSPFGAFINADASSDILGSVRLPTGESVFVFGSFQPNGLIAEITGAVLVNDQGEQASVVFEGGRLAMAGSFDGSTAAFTYEEFTTERLRGTVDLFFASVPAPDQNQMIEFDIDLNQAAADLAAMVQQSLGLEISDAEPPPDPLARPRLADAARAGLPKDMQSAQLVFLFAQFHVSAFAALGFAMVRLVAHVVEAVMELVVGLVRAITRAVVVAVMTPFILMGDVLRLTVNQPIIILNFDLEFNFDIPLRPHRRFG